MDRGAWWATYSPWGNKELDMTEWLTIHRNSERLHQKTVRITEFNKIEGHKIHIHKSVGFPYNKKTVNYLKKEIKQFHYNSIKKV